MASKLSGVELTRYDDLFKTDAEREADKQERIQIVPATEIFPYARQPYAIDRPTPDLVRLMDSIEHIGIAEPLIVRPRDAGGYEIISGHRRDYCAKAVGLDTRPVIVRNYSDEEADILVVDYNINREDLLPSEKAKAYKLKLDAMKRQAGRPSKNSLQVGENFRGKYSVQVLADQVADNATAIQRYIRLNMRSNHWTITNLLIRRIQNMNLNKKNLWKPMEPNKVKRRYWTAAGAAALCLCCATPAMAAGGDPLDIVNNLSDFIFSIIKALGVIILGWGIVQVGMSIQSHDASQRTQGFLCLFGGLMIAFAKEILTAIGAI